VSLDVGEWRDGEPLPVRIRFLAHARSLPPGGLPIEWDVPRLAVQLSPLNVAAPKATLRIAGSQIEGDFSYRRSADAHFSAHGALVAHTPSVRKLAAELALNQTLPHDPTALGPLELTTAWSYTDGELTAKPLTLKLDGVNFNGWVERSSAPRAAWRFELHGDRVDLGRYLNVDTTSTKPFELPVEMLRAFNANGSVMFDEAILADARLSDVRLRFQTPEAKR
jgi:hypothetical protein